MAFNKKQRELIAKSYETCRRTRDSLSRMEGTRCMETTEDGYGIIWERWLLPNGVSCILVSTPIWHDVYLPADNGNSIMATLDAIKRAGGVEK